MPSHVIIARPPRGDVTAATIHGDAEQVGRYLEDAAHVPGGSASGVAFPRTEADVAAILRQATSVLPVGAQSSLTGGATPTGGVVLSSSRMTSIDLPAGGRGRDVMARSLVTAQPGVTLAALEAALESAGYWFPPAPTYTGATVGGVIATNAAGAAAFKYGPTRPWVEALTVVLPDGEVLDITRGTTVAHADGYFEIVTGHRRVRIDVPSYRWPSVPKVSAGYYAAPGMDLVDLFIGAEGTLGVVTSATLHVLAPRPTTAMALVFCPSRELGLHLVAELRRQSRETWRTRPAGGLDVSAIEHMDARCLALLREDGTDRRCGVTIPGGSALALLVTLELPPAVDAAHAFTEIGSALEPGAPDTPLVRFCRLLAAAGLLESAEIALPGARRQADLLAFREAVPAAVNQRIARAQREIDPRIQKVAADVIVPFERLDALLAVCDAEFTARGLDGAVWGHISDGNLHPNVIPRSTREFAGGREAVLAMGRSAIALGGAPCAEHGVGRNPVKQQLVAELVGASGLEAMRRVKRAIDPRLVLAPGVLGL